MTYAEVLAELYGLSPRGIEPGLSRMREALARAGDPQRAFEVVHVAGTNGKGSVSAMVATGLAAGQRVALYTSPHLASLTERLRILGGEPITEADVVRGWSSVRDALLGPGAPRVTFFEALTVLALWLFRERRVDIAVLEVGLGGRLDATNVIARPLATAITRIGLDHANFLGDDLASVAREKAGIMRPGVPAVIAPQRPEVREVLEAALAEVGAKPVDVVGDLEGLTPRLAGAHQRDNARVAITILRTLEARGLAVDVRAAVEQVEWPGRLERVRADGEFLLDAAHNAEGCATLAAYLESGPPRRRVLLFGAMSDKDWPAMLRILRPHVDALVTAAPALPRAERPEVLADAFDGEAADSPEAAITRARTLAGPKGEVVVAGSIYLMGVVRAHLLKLPMDPPIAM